MITGRPPWIQEYHWENDCNNKNELNMQRHISEDHYNNFAGCQNVEKKYSINELIDIMKMKLADYVINEDKDNIEKIKNIINNLYKLNAYYLDEQYE